MVGDACHLPELGQFGCVFAGNLICRLPEPMKFFQRLPGMIVPGGILVITSPYTWLQQYTPEVRWAHHTLAVGGSEGVSLRESATLMAQACVRVCVGECVLDGWFGLVFFKEKCVRRQEAKTKYIVR